MKNKIYILSIILLALLAVSAVSASENTTDNATDTEVLTHDVGEIDVSSDVSNDTGTVSSNGTGDAKASSQITASNVVGYTSFSTDVSAKLTSNGMALSSKTVKILINGVTYTRTTDANGKVTVGVNLAKGTYNAVFTFDGDDTTNSSTATSKITIKDATKTSLKIGDKDINYRQGSKCLFYVQLVTSAGKAIKNQMVTFKVSGKTYTAKTDKSGFAKIYLNLKKGKHKVKYSFKKNSPYLASSGSYTIKVKSKLAKGNGYWVWSSHMKSVNLKGLSKRGTKLVLLHVHAIAQYGKPAVVSFIKKAHRYGIKVHMWMQVTYSGGKWVSLVDDHGKFRYSFMKKKIAEAKRYAKIKGVDGVHFDYMRYGGTAHKHPHATDSVNYFVKKASKAIRSVNSKCVVSVAVMPEPSMMIYYYGQDIPTLSKYVDSIIPMVYRGNYHQTRAWVTSVTKSFSDQSNGAQIWTGLQSYYSDNNAKKLPQKTLLKDAKAAKKGGAVGIVLFRIGISCNFNFKKV